MSGSNNIKDLHSSVRSWWTPWADAAGEVRGNYGQQLRRYGSGFDQVAHFVVGIREHPYSRRNVLTTWHAEDMADPATPITNCHHTVTQAFVEPSGSLHLVTYQRSADAVVGLPVNWLQTWAFLLWLAARTGHRPGSLLWIGGDVHVYDGHRELAERIVQAARHCPTSRPELLYEPSEGDFRASDFRLSGEYRPVLDERAEMVV